jgi:hypothetical protein
VSANDHIELQPGELETMQAEEFGPDPSVNVVVDEIKAPVRVQELPRKAGATRTYTLSSAPGQTPRRIASNNNRRASLVMVAYGGDILVSYGGQAAQDPSTMARWPEAAPLPLTATASIFVRPYLDNATVQLSVITEMWATGE